MTAVQCLAGIKVWYVAEAEAENDAMSIRAYLGQINSIKGPGSKNWKYERVVLRPGDLL